MGLGMLIVLPSSMLNLPTTSVQVKPAQFQSQRHVATPKLNVVQNVHNWTDQYTRSVRFPRPHITCGHGLRRFCASSWSPEMASLEASRLSGFEEPVHPESRGFKKYHTRRMYVLAVRRAQEKLYLE